MDALKTRLRGSRIKPILSVSVLGVLLLGHVRPASAEVVLFEARIKANDPRPTTCPEGAYICGSAAIAGFGSAEYWLTLHTLRGVGGACVSPSGTSTGGSYTATVTFTLQDGSVLILNEEGIVCGPGASLTVPSSYRSYGNPVDGSGAWVVQSATGQFSGLTGSGADSFHSAGAEFSGTYLGTLKR